MRSFGRLVPVLALLASVALVRSAVPRPGPAIVAPPYRPLLVVATGTANPVSWPPSTGLLIGELVTGGASASDEFVEIVATGSTTLDLAGFELVYVTSTGGTVTRKASWPSTTLLAPGRRFLLANAAGVYASVADATWSSGLAATGGSLVLRPIGGAPIDAVGWGDATNAYVESWAATAPPAGSSIERRPGGLAGNGQDTNDNAADFLVQSSPAAQGLAAPPVPAPSASPTPTPEPTPTPTPEPTPTPTPDPTPTPTPDPTPTPTPAPTPTATPVCAPASPSPTPMPTPSPSPTAPVAEAAIPIGEARTLPVGTRVRIAGVVTAEPGRIGSSPGIAAIQDGDSGIALRVASDLGRFVRGLAVEVAGTIGQAYGMLDLRMEDASLVLLDPTAPPLPDEVEIAEVGEATEGRLVTVAGEVGGSPTVTASGDVSFDLLDEAGGRVRIVGRAGSGLLRSSVVVHGRYRITGVSGQRATATGRLDGYRIWIRDLADIVLEASPRPSATVSPGATTTATASPGVLALASIGTVVGLAAGPVRVEGVVTIPATLLDASARRLVIEDATGAVELLLPPDAAASGPGTRLTVAGEIGRAYGAPRIRVRELVASAAGSPVPRPLATAPGERDEWRLVRIAGPVETLHRLGERWVAEVRVGGELVPVVGLPGSGIASTALDEGRAATVIGIVRRPYPSASDRRFAVVPRSPADLAVGPAPSPSPSPAPSRLASGGGTGGGGRVPARAPATAGVRGAPTTPPRIDLGVLGDHRGERVVVSGIVLDVGADEVLLDDGTATGRLVLAGSAAPLLAGIASGDALEVTAEVLAGDGAVALRVADPAEVRLLGSLGERIPVPAAGADAAAAAARTADADERGTVPSAPPPAPAATSSAAPDPDPGSGLAALLAGAAASLVLLTLRLDRRRRTGPSGVSEDAMVGS